MVKGCDRTIVQFLQEGLIKRENVVIIGVPCTGVVPAKRLSRRPRPSKRSMSVASRATRSIVEDRSGEKRLALADICPDKCKTLPVSRPPSSTTCSWESRSSRTRAPIRIRRHQGHRGKIAGREEGILGKRVQPLHPLLRVPERLPPVRLPGFLHRRDARSPLA